MLDKRTPRAQRLVTLFAALVVLGTSAIARTCSAQTPNDIVRSSQPPLLTYSELVELGEHETVDPALQEKLHTLLTTPFINNEAYFEGVKPLRPNLDGMGPCLRVVMWNIERGIELDNIRLALTDKPAFLAKARAAAAAKGDKGDQAALMDKISADLDVLQTADVLVLNEVDWGMKRSDYKAVVKELGDALKMNWVYGVEFVEVDPKILGTQSFADVKDEAERKELDDLFSVDRSRLRGLHGTAILSRYPLRDVKLVPFERQAYDWYNGEKKYGALEVGKRKVGGLVFGETLLREVRRGGRTNLIATVDIPGIPDGKVTIVAAHLENRAKPKARRQEMDEILQMLRPIHNPIIIAGDMNTTGSDGSVLSINSYVLKQLNSPSFWATKGVKYATGVGFGMDIVSITFKTAKFQSDPTASGIPLLAANPEQGLFKDLRAFRFDDGTRIDFRGDAALSTNGRTGTLSNSNERGSKGFMTTFALPRTFGIIGNFRLDWIFVDAQLKEDPKSADSYRFAPAFPRTMNEVNEAFEDRLSDHAPISVDIPLTRPALPGANP